MNLHEHLRKMARSTYWQEIYNASKMCSGINLFKNTYNFSGIQKLFLYYLRLYNMLYDELHEMRWHNLTEDVIKDDDRLDAFLYYRRKQQEKELREYNKEQRKASREAKKGTHFKVFQGAKNKEGGTE